MAMDGLARRDPVEIAGYRMLARLGDGGMGRVFLARSPAGEAVAFKLIRPDVAGDVEFRSRFAREAQAARRLLGRRGIAAVLDADPDGPEPWLASQYVPGISLHDAVFSHGPLPLETVRTLARGLAEALTDIHASGLTHRDLKPSNIMLALDGPRVIDFGIARAADASKLTRTGLLVGSPGFMSPEQVVGTEVGPGTDVFALGSVLVHALTGEGPYGDGPPAALLYRVVNAPPNLAAVPQELRDVIERCLT
ncbi:serine/threonine protein kinase, partial [Actinospica durhamensis]|nr:serine/threonine protein kinase [Actinospica durhamensis]